VIWAADKQDKLALALSDLLVETTRLGVSSADAVNIAFSTVAQIVCHGVPRNCDQDFLVVINGHCLHPRVMRSPPGSCC
jgi:hypothetical protein